jgi:putative flippase GtrA
LNRFKSFIKKKILIQFFSYSIVGVFSTAIDFLVYFSLQYFDILGASNAKRISYLFGTINSFYFNKKITFKSYNKMSSEFFRYVIVWTTSFFLNTITHDYLLSTFNNYLPFIISAIISVLINFSGAKFWVFKK